MTAAISPPRRERNGRRQRQTTKAEIEAAQRAREEAEKAVVMSQPHRRGSTDQKCTTALGRFVLAHKLREELYLAGEEYAGLVRRWRLTVAAIRVEGHKAIGSAQGDLDRDAIERLTNRVSAADGTLKRLGAYPWVRHVVIDHPTEDIRALPPEARPLIIDGLFALAVHFGMLPPGRG